MNGRVYDYNLGRFLGVDPIIAFPENSQSLNPYSYILNNPLSGTDPSGYTPTCQDDAAYCGRNVVGSTSFDCQRGANCSSLLVYVDNGVETNAGQILLVGDVSQLEGRQSIGVEEINIVEDRHGDITITIALGGTEAKAPIVTFTSRRGKQQILPGIPSDISQLKTPSRYAGYFKYDLEQDYPDLGTGNSMSATEFFSTIVAAVLCQCNPNAAPDPAFPDAIQSVGSPFELFLGSGSGVLGVIRARASSSNLKFGRKLDFLFNRDIDPKVPYNLARARGNSSRAGIADNVINRLEVMKRFNRAYNDPASIIGPGHSPGSFVREFFLPGITGSGSVVQFVEQGGRVITIIVR
jgi:hypothetical protein